MAIEEKLMRIQTQIKAPKNLYNSFGKYKYRNAEGICEAVKPYLEKEKCSLILSDEIIDVGGRVYVKAEAVLTDIETRESSVVTAYAREASEKKGMDDSQITGTASSYARKYALNGLFLLDDTKDADSEELKVEQDARFEKQMQNKVDNLKDLNKVAEALKNAGIKTETVLSLYNVKDFKSLTTKQCENIMKHIDDIKKKQEEELNE